MLVRRFHEHKSARKPTLRLSNIGRPLRQLWYELKGVPQEPLSPETKFKFLYGDILETLVLFLAEAAGHKVERMQEEVEVDGVPGHIDAVIDGVLVDAKSCSPFSFAKFTSGEYLENDPFGYIPQLSAYRKAIGLERAAFIPIEKVLGKISVVELPREKEADVSKRITDARSAIASDVPPERCYDPRPVSKKDKSGNLVLSVGCSYCGWKNHCWQSANGGTGLRTIIYSTGPKYFVEVAKEPRVKASWSPFEVKEQEQEQEQEEENSQSNG
jgi:hypothetical protein